MVLLPFTSNRVLVSEDEVNYMHEINSLSMGEFHSKIAVQLTLVGRSTLVLF